ncbi:MAG: hypothetical protein KDA75_13065, partial [Planctomycetaceae bacterium]|nr:hypothetical protein [Planctomycetaceae bacterium]
RDAFNSREVTCISPEFQFQSIGGEASSVPLGAGTLILRIFRGFAGRVPGRENPGLKDDRAGWPLRRQAHRRG